MSTTLKADAVVIGSGPGGYAAGIRLGQLGVNTIVVERADAGGVCLNVGCIPSKALIHAAKSYEKLAKSSDIGIMMAAPPTVDMVKMQAWKAGVVKKLTSGVEMLLKSAGTKLVKGTGRLAPGGPRRHRVVVEGGPDGTQTIDTDNVIIATGSRPIEIPGFAVDGKRVIDSTGALALDHVPDRMVVIGGGYIGLELGTVYAKLGAQVTVVEALDSVLATMDPDCVKVVARKLKKMGVSVLTRTRAKSWREVETEAEAEAGAGNGAEAGAGNGAEAGAGNGAEAGTGAEAVAKAGAEIGGETEARTGALLTIETDSGETRTIEADVILLSIGRRPNSEGLGLTEAGVVTDPRGFIPVDDKLRTNVAGIYAIGDVAGGMLLAHKASKEAEVVAEIIAGKDVVQDARTIPAVVFTDPEIASTGMTEAEARAAGHETLKVGKFPFAALGRALSVNDTEGFAKVIGDGKTGEVLGVHIVGNGASDLISEAALAIEMHAEVADLMLTVHPHPTMPEALREAAAAALGEAIHIVNR